MSGEEIFIWGTVFGVFVCILALMLLGIGYSMGKESK